MDELESPILVVALLQDLPKLLQLLFQDLLRHVRQIIQGRHCVKSCMLQGLSESLV